ncbi:hypothetical protein [Mycolicibacterium fallax]|uniref:Uncharacterized protein n=1 Tax=Mycolicibacterium fallax TaxID=1793 RepID=A0A1X1R8I8_MYCFA|nr:hypothetical protein [Mycolicibacterium fallax]ORV01194.1 hypothetical protein AWC04_14510 [Mycolicibacterium fallax]BBY98215.1 hypothetical protein MFAL_16820 [Mycolicibacterium fallax]HOW94139.1 hypothetical protein [Mycolicibacterium fallax]
MKFTLPHSDEHRRWPSYMFWGRMRTSTFLLICAFLLTYWVYDNYAPGPPEPAPAQHVPDGYTPVFVPKTNVYKPTWTPTVTTPTPAPTPTETVPPEPTVTTTTETTPPPAPVPWLPPWLQPPAPPTTTGPEPAPGAPGVPPTSPAPAAGLPGPGSVTTTMIIPTPPVAPGAEPRP